ncbi:maleylacetoacetate isomerase [Shimia biformata]|uniref:maleylacetoacetate isomerase n=1 Tax=Shimia biformata TaxID=1294299 RepID=UPI00195117FF
MSEALLFDYWRSSASYRVRIALNLAGVPWRSVPVDLVAGAQKGAEHMARNPQGLVPVLEIDGQRFTQSLAILEYLDTTRGMGWVPSDPVQAAHVRALAHALAVDVHPVCNLGTVAYAASLTGDRDTTMRAWMQRFIRPGLEAFEVLLAGFTQSPFCCGDAPMLPDLCLIPQLYNARRWEVDFGDLPRIVAVEKACQEVPAFIDAAPMPPASQSQ